MAFVKEQDRTGQDRTKQDKNHDGLRLLHVQRGCTIHKKGGSIWRSHVRECLVEVLVRVFLWVVVSVLDPVQLGNAALTKICQVIAVNITVENEPDAASHTYFRMGQKSTLIPHRNEKTDTFCEIWSSLGRPLMLRKMLRKML